MNMIKRILSALILISSLPLVAQVNPNTQIDWAAASGAGAPTSSCPTDVQINTPYTDLTNITEYICTQSGWVLDSAYSQVTGQADNVIPLATGSTTLGAQSHINENTPGYDTFTQAISGTNEKLTGSMAAGSYYIGSDEIIPSTITGYHGSSGTKIQVSDGTGATGDCAAFASDGSLTDGGSCGGGGGGIPTGSIGKTLSYSSTSTVAATSLYLDASQFSGADFGAKVNACITAVDTAGGGTCDARALSGTQSSTETITVGDGTHQTILLWPIGTVTFSSGHNVFYRSNSTITGSGYTSEIICSAPSTGTSCLQSYNENSGQLGPASVTGLNVQSTGATAIAVGGPSYADVLVSRFDNLFAGGTVSYGMMIGGDAGCTCYNSFGQITANGSIAGVYLVNNSGYSNDVNSNTFSWIKAGGSPIGVLDNGGGKNTFSYIDAENNTNSAGSIIAAVPNFYYGGTGYNIGDTVRPTGGDSTAVLTVSAESGGVVSALNVTTPGTTYSNATSSTTTTLTGSGSGLQVDLITSSAIAFLDGSNNSLVINPYEENSGADYICGSGNMILNALNGQNGAVYEPRYCTGPVVYGGGPPSNFVWGPGSVPQSIGVGYNGISFGTQVMYTGYGDFNLAPGSQGSQDAFNAHLKFGASQFSTYGRYGHSPLYVGGLEFTSGVNGTGWSAVTALSNPSAPTVVATCTGSCTTTYTYYVVGYDFNGGITLPSSATTINNGPATLSSTQYITITPPEEDGIYCWNVLKGDTAHVLPPDPPNTAACGGLNAAPSAKDEGQALNAFTAPTRNTTGDLAVAGNLSAGTFTQAATAPTGSCVTTGGWVLSQNGVITWCDNGTWTVYSNGGDVTDGSGTTTAGIPAQSTSVSHQLSYSGTFSVPINSPAINQVWDFKTKFAASGSNETMTCTATENSASLTSCSGGDFTVGEYVYIPEAGSVPTASSPVSPTIACGQDNGGSCTGSTVYCYKITATQGEFGSWPQAPFPAFAGMTAPSSSSCITQATQTTQAPDDDSAVPDVYTNISWTVPSGANGVAIYKSINGGPYYFYEVMPSGTTSTEDFNHAKSAQFTCTDLGWPCTVPTGSTPNGVFAQISSVSGSTYTLAVNSLITSNPYEPGVSGSVVVQHDDTPAFGALYSALLNNSGNVQVHIGAGHYMLHSYNFGPGITSLASTLPLFGLSNVDFTGDGKGTTYLLPQENQFAFGECGWATSICTNIAFGGSDDGYTLSDPEDAGSSQITLATPSQASNFTVGGYITIRNDASGYPEEYYAEINKVTAINTTTGVLTLAYPLDKTYSASLPAPYSSCSACNGTPKAYPIVNGIAASNLTFENMTIRGPSLLFNYNTIDGLYFRNDDLEGLEFQLEGQSRHIGIFNNKIVEDPWNPLANNGGMIMGAAASADIIAEGNTYIAAHLANPGRQECSEGSANITDVDNVQLWSGSQDGQGNNGTGLYGEVMCWNYLLANNNVTVNNTNLMGVFSGDDSYGGSGTLRNNTFSIDSVGGSTPSVVQAFKFGEGFTSPYISVTDNKWLVGSGTGNLGITSYNANQFEPVHGTLTASATANSSIESIANNYYAADLFVINLSGGYIPKIDLGTTRYPGYIFRVMLIQPASGQVAYFQSAPSCSGTSSFGVSIDCANQQAPNLQLTNSSVTVWTFSDDGSTVHFLGKNYKDYQFPATEALGNQSGNITISNFGAFGVASINMTGNITNVNLSSHIAGYFYSLEFTQPASGGPYTLPATCANSGWGTGNGIQCINGIAPVANPAASSSTIISFYDDGTNTWVLGSNYNVGSVSNFSAPSESWPSWLVPTVTNSTTSPSLAVAATSTGTGNVVLNTDPTFPDNVNINGDLTIGASGYISTPAIAGTGTAAFTVGTAAGTGATASCNSGHICDSTSGEINFNTGTSSVTNGLILTVNFPYTRAHSANCVINFQNYTGGFVDQNIGTTESTTNLEISDGPTALSTTSSYTIDYWCGGN